MVTQGTPMSRPQKSRDFSLRKEQDGRMASRREEALGAAWEGADLERPIIGEDPTTDSLREARRWVTVYSHLITLEQELLDVLAGTISKMPSEAQREAERTNLPVLASQVERFRHRLEYWIERRTQLEARAVKGVSGEGPEA